MHNNPLPVGDTVAHPPCIYGEDPEVPSESVRMQVNEESKLCTIMSARYQTWAVATNVYTTGTVHIISPLPGSTVKNPADRKRINLP